MTEEQKKKTEKKIMIISIGIMVLAVAFLIVVGVTGTADTLLLPIGLSAFLAVYWLISDVFSVIWMKSFEGKTDEQKRAYYTYALIDAVGFAGLVYFIVDLRGTTGAIIFAASVFLKRRFQDEFRGVDKNEEPEADEEVSQENEAADGEDTTKALPENSEE